MYKPVISNNQINEHITEQHFDLIDGKQFDTYIKIDAEICIAGDTREEFYSKLKMLINKYSI